ncbi:MAG TPA: TIGR03087 family PEP-CTERM/XrtA system glycosyltransferase [Candidatus Eisenbacteria bacterium]|nr:TIGR03087 family PEP-CTERM/XrtA system glycosyltransferase [Candidatus Eisenbacteria bacterium]
MNILYLCHRIPYPPNKGDKIRSFNQIQYLSREHRLHVGCLIDAEEDRGHVAALRPYCASLDAVWRGKAGANFRAARALLGKGSLSVAAFHSPDLARRIERRLSEEAIDVAVVFSSQMGQYLPRGADLPTVVDFVDVDSEKWRVYSDMKPWPLSWLYRIEADRLRRYETLLARTHDESVFVAEKEADVFRRGAEGVRARSIPNGVDLDYYSTPPDRAARAADSRALVFVGMMDYFPNIDAVRHFADRIFPRILAVCPSAVFRIVGRNPSKRVRGLGALRNVEVVGQVPDVRPYLADAAVSVAPFRVARGVQNKILEAMAMGVPVVGTPIAFQGIPAGPEDGVRIEEQPESFAEAVTAFLGDPASRHEAGRRGRRFVERHHRWQDHGAALAALLSEVVERHGGRIPSAGGRR